MEQTKEKHYDLIVSLITSHRKFAGLENYLEDIVREVYSKAETVLENVDDDAILESYLQKIVSTAIIMVAKNLNINNRKSTPVQIVVNTPTVQIEQTEPEQISIETDNTISEDIENVVEDDITNIPEDDIRQTNETLLTEFPTDIVSNSQDDILENNSEIITEEEMIPQSEFDMQNTLDLKTPEVDEHLVENFINGTDNNLGNNTDISINADLDTIYPKSDNNEEAEVFTLDLTTELDIANEPVELSPDNEDEVIDLVEDFSQNSNVTELNLKDYKLPSFDKLLTNSTLPCGVEAKYIFYELEHIQKKFPETKVKEVFKLKCVEHKSVQEISDELGIAPDTVVAILSDIVNFVKDF